MLGHPLRSRVGNSFRNDLREQLEASKQKDNDKPMPCFDMRSGSKNAPMLCVVPDLSPSREQQGGKRTVRIFPKKQNTADAALGVLRDVRWRLRDEKEDRDWRLSQVVSPHGSAEQGTLYFQTEPKELKRGDTSLRRNPAVDLKRRVDLMHQVVSAQGNPDSADGLRDMFWRVSHDLKSIAEDAGKTVEAAEYYEAEVGYLTEALVQRDAQARRDADAAQAREVSLRAAAQRRESEQAAAIARLRLDLDNERAARGKADDRAERVLAQLARGQNRPCSAPSASRRESLLDPDSPPSRRDSVRRESRLGDSDNKMSIPRIEVLQMQAGASPGPGCRGDAEASLCNSGNGTSRVSTATPDSKDLVTLNESPAIVRFSTMSRVSSAARDEDGEEGGGGRNRAVSEYYNSWTPELEPPRGVKGQVRCLSEMRERIRSSRLESDSNFLSFLA